MATAIKFRQAVERQIVRRIVRDAIKAGFSLDVNDSEEITVKRSTDANAIMAALMTTDNDWLILRRGELRGWVWLVYGNDGWDVVNDYTTNIEDVMTGANALAERLEEKYA